MRHTYQIRRYISLAAALAFSGCMLFGCTRADINSSSQGASGTGGAVGQSTVAGTTADSTLAGAGAEQNTQPASDGTQNAAAAQAPEPAPAAQQAGGQTAQQAGGQTAQQAGGQTAQNISGTTTAAAPAAPAQDVQSVPQQTVDAAPEEAYVQTVDDYDENAADVEEAFSGEFERSDGEESVVISLVNDNEISFQFGTSGISAYARADGSTAVYHGDDGYTISFDVAGDTLGVVVDGEDSGISPLNGVYYRVLDGGENDGGEDEEEYAGGQDDDEWQEDYSYQEGDGEEDPDEHMVEVE